MEILLIEDDPRVSDFLVRGLQAEGYSVQLINTGRAGLAAAETFSRHCLGQSRAGVVILDIMLPELDGLAICQILRQRGHHIPVLMLSAMGESNDRVDGLRRGADDYLAKPFDFDELLARIEALMRRSTRLVQTEAPKIGDIILDRNLPGLRNAETEILLSVREMALIDLLVAHAGTTVSRERILSRVWQVDRDPLTNVVDVYVSRLRRKIAQLDPAITIMAVRSMGYRIVVARP
jgi:DNA-binding response OmpR family regulator